MMFMKLRTQENYNSTVSTNDITIASGNISVSDSGIGNYYSGSGSGIDGPAGYGSTSVSYIASNDFTSISFNHSGTENTNNDRTSTSDSQ